MAATTSFSAATRFPVEYGRSGYNNKPDDDDDDHKNMGRSGYNKGGNGDDDEEES